MVALNCSEMEQHLRSHDAAIEPLLSGGAADAYGPGNAALATIPIYLDAEIESMGI